MTRNARDSKEITAALRDAGATLIRSKKHRIYRLDNGRIFVMAKSPSDHRSEQNTLHHLRKLLREGKQQS